MRGNLPKKAVTVGGQVVVLRGNLAAFEAYEEVSGGHDLIDCFQEIQDDLLEFEKTGRSKRLKSAKILELLWAFSATWRFEQGLDHKDDQTKPPRERDSFRQWADYLSYQDLRGGLGAAILNLFLQLFDVPIIAVPTHQVVSDGAAEPLDTDEKPATIGT